jgi:D-alanyl-lipoteichoic acid acyltransferase DltB (MBOAT superfamily)
MLFNSIEYLLFLPIIFLLYWFVFNKLKVQNLLVVVASYIFYGWWDKSFLLLIAFTTLCSYTSGLGIEYSRRVNKCKSGGVKWDWWIAAANIIINLLILAVYKYFNFFADSFASLCESFGYHPGRVTLQLVLPVGISFYTFQALSYTIDVYKRKLEPTHDVVAFFAFISFFPQLVAGPIERATNLLPQFLKPRKFDYQEAADGVKLIIWGFFKKMAIADTASEITEIVFGSSQHCTTPMLWLGAVLFSFQIYGDFSGYSDIAIGTARLFGVRLMKNFNLPYLSRNIAEFWKRWHISLNTWFVDYLYIPLGGSREGKAKTIRNTFAIFLVSGLWHGANWTFVIWGAYHALLFVPLLLIGKTKKFGEYNRKESFKLSWTIHILMTFVLAVVGWVIFRADSIQLAAGYLKGMFGMTALTDQPIGLPNFTLLAIGLNLLFLIVMEFLHRGDDIILQFRTRYAALNWAGYLIVAYWALLFYKVGQQFIYFQF